MAVEITGRLSYREALASGQVRALVLAQLLATVGISVDAVALTILIFRRTGSPLLASLSFTLTFLPNLVAAGALGGVAARVPPRTLSAGGLVGAAALAGLLALPGLPLAALFALLAVSSTAFALRSGATATLMRDAVDARAYPPARSLSRIASQVGQFAGNGVGGILVGVGGPSIAILLGATAIATAAVVVRFGVPAPRVLDHSPPDLPRTPGARSGGPRLRALLADAELRRLLLVGCLSPMCFVAPEAVAAAYVADRHAGAAAVGVWMLALPVGLVIGDLAGVGLLSAERQRRLLAPGLVASFLPFLAFALEPGIGPAIGLLVVSGALGFTSVGLDVRLRSAAPEASFARVMSLSSGAMMTTQALGFLIAGAVAEATSPATAIVLAGIAGIAVVAVTLGGELTATRTG